MAAWPTSPAALPRGSAPTTLYSLCCLRGNQPKVFLQVSIYLLSTKAGTQMQAYFYHTFQLITCFLSSISKLLSLKSQCQKPFELVYICVGCLYMCTETCIMVYSCICHYHLVQDLWKNVLETCIFKVCGLTSTVCLDETWQCVISLELILYTPLPSIKQTTQTVCIVI